MAINHFRVTRQRGSVTFQSTFTWQACLHVLHCRLIDKPRKVHQQQLLIQQRPKRGLHPSSTTPSIAEVVYCRVLKKLARWRCLATAKSAYATINIKNDTIPPKVEKAVETVKQFKGNLPTQRLCDYFAEMFTLLAWKRMLTSDNCAGEIERNCSIAISQFGLRKQFSDLGSIYQKTTSPTSCHI